MDAFCAINLTMPMRFHSLCFSPELMISAMAFKFPLGTGDLFSKFRGSSPLIQFALEYRLFGDHKNTRLKRRLIAIVHGFCRIKSSEDNYSSCGQNILIHHLRVTHKYHATVLYSVNNWSLVKLAQELRTLFKANSQICSDYP